MTLLPPLQGWTSFAPTPVLSTTPWQSGRIGFHRHRLWTWGINWPWLFKIWLKKRASPSIGPIWISIEPVVIQIFDSVHQQYLNKFLTLPSGVLLLFVWQILGTWYLYKTQQGLYCTIKLLGDHVVTTWGLIIKNYHSSHLLEMQQGWWGC